MNLLQEDITLNDFVMTAALREFAEEPNCYFIYNFGFINWVDNVN